MMLKHRVLYMKEQGLDNRILCNDGPYVRKMREAGIGVGTVSVPRGFNLFKVLISLIETTVYLKREKIDLVHTHFSIPGFVGRVAARLAGVPVVVHTIHGFPFHANSSRLEKAIYILLERSVGGLADVVLSQNRRNLEEAVEYGIVARDRLRHIGNGIQLDRFTPAPRLTPPGGVFTITCVARLEMVKNHDMLFEAAHLLMQEGRRFRIVLVGDGDLRERHERTCKRLGLAERVQFLGYREDVPELLAHTDIATLVSLKEGIPRAIMEAMAMALPFVATRIGGNVDAVRDGETGFLVEPGDVAGLAARLAQLMDDDVLRARMGAQAREVAVREFDEDAISEALSQVYRGLLYRKGIVHPVTVPQAVAPSHTVSS
jgi:glycosyltransferase involved in cell wall biosynthesis